MAKMGGHHWSLPLRCLCLFSFVIHLFCRTETIAGLDKFPNLSPSYFAQCGQEDSQK